MAFAGYARYGIIGGGRLALALAVWCYGATPLRVLGRHAALAPATRGLARSGFTSFRPSPARGRLAVALARVLSRLRRSILCAPLPPQNLKQRAFSAL